MVEFVFTKKSKKIFLSLPDKIQDRIVKKLKALKSHSDIFVLLKRIFHFEPATHRLRIGEYRLILELKKQGIDLVKFLVLDVGYKRGVYRG